MGSFQQHEMCTIPEHLIDPPECGRALDSELIARLVTSIQAIGGLIQRIGVIRAKGDRYRVVWGNHRLHACRKAGLTDVDAVLLPSGTTATDEASFRIQENQLRSEEHFMDVLAAIEHHAKVTGCSPRKSAEANGVKPAMLTKLRKVDERVSADVKKLARENGTGITVLYEIAKVISHAEQMRLLHAYLDGELSRDDIAKTVKPAKGEKRKVIAFRVPVDGQEVQLALPAGCDDYDSAAAFLTAVKARFQQRQKQDIPFEKMPELVS